jgi:hypothetical protein
MSKQNETKSTKIYGKNSIVLIAKPAKRQGAVGLLKLFASCPVPFPAPARHRLPFK